MSQLFNSWLGMTAGSEPHSIELETRPEHEVMPGTVHFAVLTTLAEVAASQAAQASVVPATVQVQLLRRAEPGKLVARGTLIRRGRKMSVCEGEVFQGDRLVAKATVNFAVLG